MSLRETMSLAHTAQCKLHMAASDPDRNLRFVLGHALTLDNLSLRLVEIEEEQAAVRKPKHASGVKFKAAGGPGAGAPRRRSPPPSRLQPIDPDEVDDGGPGDEEDDAASDDEQGELSLTRFPSGSAEPTKYPEPPPLVASDEDSSSSDEDELPSPSDEELRGIVAGQKGDAEMAGLYNSLRGCRCHGKTDKAPDVSNMWMLPKNGTERDGVRYAVAEVPAVAA